MIAIVLGTRPEIIKMAPVIRECAKRSIDYVLIHTGQHYSYELDSIFFKELGLPEANYSLGVGSGTDAEQTSKMLVLIERTLLKTEPDVVLVEGDTNSVFAGAFAATKLHVDVGHVEAGLRSYDKLMPEEINRVLTDHISDFLFTPTKEAKNNLLAEGIAVKKTFITGNTIVDAVNQHLELARKKESEIFSQIGVEGDFFLVTSHRRENVDSQPRLSNIIKGLLLLYKEYNTPILFPMHPRTRKRISEFNLDLEGVTPVAPVGFLEFLGLEANAKLILTDSGGVQEEACILRVPCVTLRDNTERPETLAVGANMLVGADPDCIRSGAKTMLDAQRTWKNPFGDGHAAHRIMSILKKSYKSCGVSL